MQSAGMSELVILGRPAHIAHTHRADSQSLPDLSAFLWRPGAVSTFSQWDPCTTVPCSVSDISDACQEKLGGLNINQGVDLIIPTLVSVVSAS